MQLRLFAAVAVTCLAACATPRGGDPLPLVPAAAESALLIPSVADLQRNAAAFLAGIEGTSGLLELAAERFGLDLRSPEGPARLGLDPTRGLALYTLRGEGGGAPAVVATLSVAERDTFREAVALRLTRSAGLTAAPEANPRLFTAEGLAVASGLADSAEGPLGVLVFAASAAEASTLWPAAAARPATSFVGSPRDHAAAPSALRFAARFDLPEAPAGLGLLRGVLDNVAAHLSTWKGTVSLDADRLSLTMSTLPNADLSPLPVTWVNPDKPSASRLAAAFPRTTTGFLRFRVNLDKVRALPGFVRNNVLPEQLPGLEALPLPATADLIQQLDGDLAVALLGLAPGARLADLASANPSRLAKAFRVAFAAGLRDPAAFKRTYAAIAEQLGTSGWTVAPIRTSREGGWTGWTFAFDGRHVSVLHDDQLAVFIVGEGEVDTFIAVREGRALPLDSFADPAATSKNPLRALGQVDDPGVLGLLLSPLRLTRELAARNVPPYFLKIINDIRLFSGDLSATSDAVQLNWEVQL